MDFGVLKDFKFEGKVSEELIIKYEDRVPSEIIDLWKLNGFGTFLNGFLKVVNPDDYKEIIEKSYFRGEISIPIFATGMGDIISWEENRYLRLIEYRKGIFKGISAGFEFFFSDLEDIGFCEKYLDSKQYSIAIEKYGAPDFNECFGYVPLLGLGGVETVENLKKVNLIQHINLINEIMGPIQ